ncbi:MAG: ABC transporter permease subunit [Psychrobacter sp.]
MIDPLYFDVFIHSLWMAGITTVICLLLGYPFAWFVSRLSKYWQPLLMLMLILPFWTNSLVRTYALKLLFANNGLINKLLLSIIIIDTPIDILYTQGAVIAGLTYLLFPFMVLPLYAVFSDLCNDRLLASQDLGASESMMVRTVLIPVIFPAVMSGWLLAFTLSLDDVVVSTFVTGPSYEILPLRIYSMVRVGLKPEVNAIGTILLVASLILVVISQLLLRRR